MTKGLINFRGFGDWIGDVDSFVDECPRTASRDRPKKPREA